MSDTELELKDMEGDEDNKDDDDEDNMEANEDIQSNSEKEESLNNPTESSPHLDTRRYSLNNVFIYFYSYMIILGARTSCILRTYL